MGSAVVTNKNTSTPRKTKASNSIEKEAEKFLREKLKETSGNDSKYASLLSSPEELRFIMAASILSGLLAASGYNRAEELVDEALRYTDILLRRKR